MAADTKVNLPAIESLPSLLRHLRWFRYFGATPCTINEKSLADFSKTYVVWTATIMFSIVLGHSWELFANYISSNKSGVLPYAKFFRVSFSFFKLSAILSLIVLNRFKQEKTIKRLLTLQQVLGISDYNMFPSSKALALLWALCMIVRGVGTIIMDDDVSFTLVVIGFVWNVHNMYYGAIGSQFLYLVNCICRCFSTLSSTVKLQDGKGFVRIHTELCSISKDINGFYDFIVSVILVQTFIEVIYLTRWVYDGHEAGQNKEEVFALAWLIMIVSITLMIIHSCQSLSDEAELCDSVYLEYLIESTIVNPPQFTDPLSLTQLSRKNGYTFSAMKTVSINYNLGTSMVAAYITYMIVYFQIDFWSFENHIQSIFINTTATPELEDCVASISK